MGVNQQMLVEGEKMFIFDLSVKVGTGGGVSFCHTTCRCRVLFWYSLFALYGRRLLGYVCFMVTCAL